MQNKAELKGRALAFLFLLWTLWFMNIGIRAVFSPILPIIEDEFSITHARASSIYLLQSAGYGVSIFFAGLYAGAFGYKKSIILCLFLGAAACFLVPFARTVSMLYALACVSGVAAGIYLPSAIPLITHYFAERQWGKSIAIHDSAASFSIVSVPLIALSILHFLPWRGIFIVFGSVFCACAVSFTLASDEVRVVRPAARVHADLFKNRALWIIAATWIAASGAYWGVYFTIPLFLTKELSLSIGYASTTLGLSRLGGIAVAIMCGVLVDKFSLRKITFTMLLSSGLLTIAVGASSARLVGVALFFQVICVTGFFPMGLVAIAKMFGTEVRGMATGVILTCSLLAGSGLGAYLLGLSGDLVSFRVGYICLGCLVALSSFLLFYLKGLD